MSNFDIVLVIIIAAFVLFGLFKGIIRMVGRVIGIIVGAYAASHFYLALYEWGKFIANGHENVGKIVAFIILFIVVTAVVDWLFSLLEKAFNFIAFIPGSKYINNVLGAVLGFLEGAIFIGLILEVISKYSFVTNFFGGQLVDSQVAPFLIMIAQVTAPLLAQAFKALKSLI